MGNRYEYDANGNITRIDEVYTVNATDQTRVLAEYTYDSLDQLLTETRYTYVGTSSTPDTTTVVTYNIDTAGNLLSATGGEHTVSYTYGDSDWSDRLTGITVDGISRTISYSDYYDASSQTCFANGNPDNWFNGTEYTNLTWTQGRRLGSITKGSSTYTYEYNMSGVRSVKVADGLHHEYVTQNGRINQGTVL